MINIDKKKDFMLKEYQCGDCDGWFIITTQTHEKLICPFCGKTAYINGELEVNDIVLKTK